MHEKGKDSPIALQIVNLIAADQGRNSSLRFLTCYYAQKSLDSSLTVARVGFFLDQHRDALMVEERHLDTLHAYAPRQPRYLDSTRKSGKLMTRWNLVVPDYVLQRQWEEAG